MPLPSGRQLEIVRGGQRAVVTEVGGGLREYSREGRPVLWGYAAGEMCSGGRGQALLPWPNRLRDGRYEFGGRTHQLALSEPELGNAIHGLTRWLAWGLSADGPGVALATCHLHPQPGYPFHLEVAIRYALEPDGLEVTLLARNRGPQVLPFGYGHHPYLAPGAGGVDTMLLEVAAGLVLEVDGRGLPTGTRPPPSGLDFRAGRPVGTARLDHSFTQLERDPAGIARVRAGGTTLWLDAGFGWVQVYSGDGLAGPDRRGALAVEPMTCPPNAFQSGEGLLRLEPGALSVHRWGIVPG